MAAADKTYVTKEQYLQVRNWWLKTRKKQKRELGYEIWMYPFSCLSEYDKDGKLIIEHDPQNSNLDIEYLENFNEDEEFTLWNTSTKTDIWIYKNCPLGFIQARIQEKLSTYWYMEIEKGQTILNLKSQINFKYKDRIMSITNDNINLYFWRKLDNEYIETIDKMIVYGTTKVFEIIHTAQRLLDRYEEPNNDNNYEIEFIYCGIDFIYKNGDIYTSDDKLIVIPFLNAENFLTPKIKYSLNTKEAKNYKDDEIILSHEKEVFDLVSFESKTSLKRAILFLPEYLRNIIKERL